MHGRKLVGLNLRRLRIERGLSQERLAFDSNVDRSYLGGMERGEENPTVDVLARLAATLVVPIGALFSENDEASQPGITVTVHLNIPNSKRCAFGNNLFNFQSSVGFRLHISEDFLQ